MNKSIDLTLDMINNLLQQEQEAGRVNSLMKIAESQGRRSSIDRYWQIIQTELASIDQQIRKLPALPPEEHILWAQSVLAMRNLAFLELDTTGLDTEDEIIRFTLIDRSLATIDDFLIKPTNRRLSERASHVNGIQVAQLEREGIALAETWKRIQAALGGRYVVSYNQGWDLQRHTFQYYHREYNLTLAVICERVGHPLPKYPHQTSLDRAKGQVHVITALADAVTDVRSVNTSVQADIDFDVDGMVDLDSHPF